MAQSDFVLLLLQLAVIGAAGLAGGQLMRRWHQPAVVGEILAGIVLGPTVLGAAFPSAFATIFPGSGPVAVGREAIIRLGMIFFLLVAGLEVDINRLRGRTLPAVLASLGGILFPFALGTSAVLLIPGLAARPSAPDTLPVALFLGVALSIAALPVIARILLDLGLLATEFGAVVMAACTLNNLVGWTLFAFLLSKWAPRPAAGSLQSAIGLLVLFAVLVVGLSRPWARTKAAFLTGLLAHPSGLIALLAGLALFGAAAAEWAGLHAMLGAFLVGVTLAPCMPRRSEAKEAVYNFAISFFAPIYFVSIGLELDFAASLDPLLTGLVLLLASLGTIGGASLGARLGGLVRREALAVGLAMNARGAMEVVMASVALEAGLIDSRLFVALVVMAVATSMMSGPLVRRTLGAPRVASSP